MKTGHKSTFNILPRSESADIRTWNGRTIRTDCRSVEHLRGAAVNLDVIKLEIIE